MMYFNLYTVIETLPPLHLTLRLRASLSISLGVALRSEPVGSSVRGQNLYNYLAFLTSNLMNGNISLTLTVNNIIMPRV